MSDFLTELRGEVLDAHAARRRRGRASLLARALAHNAPRALAATTVVGCPSAPRTRSPTATAPMVVQPFSVGRGVSSASALPRAVRASGFLSLSRYSRALSTHAIGLPGASASSVCALLRSYESEALTDEYTRPR